MEKKKAILSSVIVTLLCSILISFNMISANSKYALTEVRSAHFPSTTQNLGFDLDRKSNVLSNEQLLFKSSNSTKSWTYMLYLDADNDIERDAIQDLEEIERGVGSSADINVVILFDRIPGYDDSHGNWSGSRYYLASEDLSMFTIDSVLLEDLGEVDMGDPNTLNNFLNFCFENYPAEKYCLDLWDHGWGAHGMCADETEGSGLTLENIQYALLNSTVAYGTEIDVISMDACDMNTLEVAWELRNLCEYFVATEDVTNGYEYEPIIRGLLESPEITSFELSKLMVDVYANEFNSVSFTCLSVINESRIDDVIPYINNFAEQLTYVLTELGYKPLFSWVRKNTPDFFGKDFVDLINFAEKMNSCSNYEPLQIAANELVIFLKQLVVYNWQHSSYIGAANGISIFLPYTNKNFTYYILDNYVNQRGPFEGMDWQRDSQWDEFLELYLSQSYYLAQPSPYRLFLGEKTEEFTLNQDEGKLFRIGGCQKSTYEFTCNILSGDVDMQVLSVDGHLGGSYLINPEDGSTENCRFYLPYGSYYLFLRGKIPVSSYTVEVNQYLPQNLSCNTPYRASGGTRQGDSTGHFIQDLHHYFQVEIGKGNYTIILSNSETANYQLTLYDDSWIQLLLCKPAGFGQAFTLNYTSTNSETVLYFEVVGLEGAGSFTIEINDGMSTLSSEESSRLPNTSTSESSCGFLYSFVILIGIILTFQKKHRKYL
ncbi:MAG: hypothetical protein JSW11_14560 [Candidatus Heimdallarchaeota archaeon]|nr:MAG: hypothetical protein JSW11_14560 [Candidatus Heimdallarchaeota archaeon]